tara:strand:- start:43 stop:534 length:492 start_codon:yes stop_codon:yes gene_type:complete
MDNIKLIKNVFPEEERKKFCDLGFPFIVNWNEHSTVKGTYPGRQSPANLHRVPELIPYYYHIVKVIAIRLGLTQKVQVTKAWINWTNGKKKDIGWHTHPDCDYTCVYYMKTFPLFSNGTLFKHGLVKAPQNSLLFFPGNLEHTAPSSPLRFGRYTSAMNLNIY